MQRACTQCSTSFAIAAEDMEFYDKVSPVFAGKKYAVPPPSQCPDCRQQRRLAWRNERTLYSRICDLCTRRIVSVYPEKTPFPVYCVRCWWGDGWDALSYGVPYDLRRPFLEQFRDLAQRVPHLAIQNDEGIGSENCEYCYDISRGKNCYRTIGSWYMQDCHYSLNVNHAKDIVDCNTVSIGCELVYESLDSQRLYHCAYLQNCENCRDCFFGYHLRGCTDCFACYGLRQKRFCIFNEEHSEAEYRRKMAAFSLGSYAAVQEMRARFEAWTLQFPRKYANLQNCEDCEGNNLFHCKSVLGYSVFNSEHSKYIDRSDGPKHCYDIINTGGPQWCCDCVTPDDSYMVLFSAWCWKCKEVLLSDNCHASERLLGCLSVKRGNNCILNTPYSKEDYERIAGEIIASLHREGAWGAMLPVALSPFGYNETAAQEYFPLDRESVLRHGWKWTETLPHTTGKETRDWKDIPDDVRNVTDDSTRDIVACTSCRKNFKITPQELAIYRKMPVPLPRRCPDCRHMDRFSRKNPTKLWERQCAKCGTGFRTTFAPNRPEIVYCEACYLQATYGQ